MSRNISVGIDIGTYQIKVVVAELAHDNSKNHPKIIGVGYEESRGLRHGYIINHGDVAKSLNKALRQAEKSAGVKIKHAYASIGGASLSGTIASGSTMVSRADNEVTDADIEKAIASTQADLSPGTFVNRKIIHTIPIQYKLDGKTVLGQAVGMKGSKLEVKTLFISCLEQHINDLVDVIEEAHVKVDDVIASPIAASLVTLTKTQKIAGCVLANIGSETVSIVVFENNLPIALETFPIGSNDITNDIALGLRVPLEEAEDIKRGSLIGAIYSKKKLEEIIVARLSDIFDLIDAHLKKIGKNELLPAGIILTGGGASIETIEELAKSSLKLPSKIASFNLGENTRNIIKDASWSVAYGLCILGFSPEDSMPSGVKVMNQARNNVVGWLKQFLP